MSFSQYPKYKNSGVKWLGLIPEHWGVGQSRRLFALRNERASDADEQLTASQEYGIVRQRDFVQIEGRRVVEVIKGADILKHVEPNDFVISMRSFQGGIEWSKIRGSISSAYVMLIPCERVHPPYFSHLFKSATYIQALQSTTNLVRDGQALRYNNFVQVDLPLVPFGEQIAIAAFLDSETAKIDALIAEQERLIKLLKEKRQTVISQAVTKGLDPSVPMKPSGVEWIGSVPAHWRVVPLKRVWSVTDCKHITAEFVDNGFPIVSIREVQDEYVNLANAQRTTENYYNLLIEGGRAPQSGDLVFSRNATVGQVSQVPEAHEPFALGQDVCLLRRLDERFCPDFMQLVLKSSLTVAQIETIMIGSTFKRVNVQEIKRLEVPVPPAAEQRQIASWARSACGRIEALLGVASDSIQLLRERRSALISAAVTGQIDVRGLAEQKAA